MEQSTANLQPIPAIESVVPEKPQQNNTLVVILSVLLLIFIIVSGFFAYQTQTLVKELNNLKSNTSKVEPTFKPEPTTYAEATPDPTADWKTYNNTNLDISFKHPSDWKIRGFAGDQSNVQENGTTFSRFILESSDNKVSISFQKPFFEGGFDPCYSKIGISENVVIGNEKFTKSTYECISSNSIIIYLVSEPHNYSITAIYKTENDLRLLVDQILSTFKFTN
jgi:hypothetical protein